MHQQRCMHRIAQKNTDTRNLQQQKQGIHRHHSPPRYHNAASHASPYGPPRPNMTSSVKPEVHNVLQRCQKTTEPWPQGICTTNFVKIGPVVPEICSWTNRHTERQTDSNNLLPYRGGLINTWIAQPSDTHPQLGTYHWWLSLTCAILKDCTAYSACTSQVLSRTLNF